MTLKIFVKWFSIALVVLITLFIAPNIIYWIKGTNLQSRGRLCISMLSTLQVYQQDHGCIPYDERGPSYALYKLKGYIGTDRAWFFDGPKGVLRDLNGKASWNDEEERIENMNYDYINKPNLKIGEDQKDVVILCEKTWAMKGNIVCYVTLSRGFYARSLRELNSPLTFVGSELVSK